MHDNMLCVIGRLGLMSLVNVLVRMRLLSLFGAASALHANMFLSHTILCVHLPIQEITVHSVHFICFILYSNLRIIESKTSYG